MKYIFAAETDRGIVKEKNQDSLLVKHAKSEFGELIMAVICDGMGGLSKGELASATVVREFAKWFDIELPKELGKKDLKEIEKKWISLLSATSYKIKKFSEKNQCKMGTTFTGIILIGNQYLIVHVGDTRVYLIDKEINQLTKDQTYVEREIERGTMTKEQAKIDRRKNLLLQCIGASEEVLPETKSGYIKEGCILLCSDGFRNKMSEDEMKAILRPQELKDKKDISFKVKKMIEGIKLKKERDNISAIVIKINGEK